MRNSDGTFGKGNPGRPKGAKNRASERLRKFIHKTLSDNQSKLNQELDKLEGKEYVQSIIALLQYALPKLAATEVSGDLTGVEEFITMTSEQQQQYIKTVIETSQIEDDEQ